MNRVPKTATNVIAILTALAWLAAAVLGKADYAAAAMGFIPARFSGGEVSWATVPAVLTPLTATIVHGGLFHLAFNMLIFIWCGAAVERVLGAPGLIILYLVGAYTAALGQWVVDPFGTIPMVGASGAISAVIGAFALSFGRPKRIVNNLAVNRWINIAWLMVAWVILQAMMGWLAGGQGYLLATPAHIGGFLAGLLLQRPLLLWRYRSA